MKNRREKLENSVMTKRRYKLWFVVFSMFALWYFVLYTYDWSYSNVLNQSNSVEPSESKTWVENVDQEQVARKKLEQTNQSSHTKNEAKKEEPMERVDKDNWGKRGILKPPIVKNEAKLEEAIKQNVKDDWGEKNVLSQSIVKNEAKHEEPIKQNVKDEWGGKHVLSQSIAKNEAKNEEPIKKVDEDNWGKKEVLLEPNEAKDEDNWVKKEVLPKPNEAKDEENWVKEAKNEAQHQEEEAIKNGDKGNWVKQDGLSQPIVKNKEKYQEDNWVKQASTSQNQGKQEEPTKKVDKDNWVNGGNSSQPIVKNDTKHEEPEGNWGIQTISSQNESKHEEPMKNVDKVNWWNQANSSQHEMPIKKPEKDNWGNQANSSWNEAKHEEPIKKVDNANWGNQANSWQNEAKDEEPIKKVDNANWGSQANSWQHEAKHEETIKKVDNANWENQANSSQNETKHDEPMKKVEKDNWWNQANSSQNEAKHEEPIKNWGNQANLSQPITHNETKHEEKVYKDNWENQANLSQPMAKNEAKYEEPNKKVENANWVHQGNSSESIVKNETKHEESIKKVEIANWVSEANLSQPIANNELKHQDNWVDQANSTQPIVKNETKNEEPIKKVENVNWANQTNSSQPNVKEVEKRSDDPCWGRYIYVHDLPSRYNEDLIKQCDTLNKWVSMCKYTTNMGLGEPMRSSGCFVTDQFTLEIIFHNRMKQYKCLTIDSSKASAIFVPFYSGLEISRHLFGGYNVSVRDSASIDLMKWLKEKPEWNVMYGRDHFFVAGRITWDFRRGLDEDWHWGNKMMILPESKNMTILTIEASPWNRNDFGIPYPTCFHPSNDKEVFKWQSRMRRQKRSFLFTFVGAPRPQLESSYRSEIIEQCIRAGRKCNFLKCTNVDNKCQKPEIVMRTFQNSVFCLQPPGDSFTRRSTFDSLLAGCIPVFFHPGSAYVQYLWHLPKNFTKYSILITNLRKSNISIERVLSSIPKDEVVALRDEVIKLIPNITYANPSSRLETIEDAFDVTVKGVLERVETFRKEMREGKNSSFAFDEEYTWKHEFFGKIEGKHEWDGFFNRTDKNLGSS